MTAVFTSIFLSSQHPARHRGHRNGPCRTDKLLELGTECRNAQPDTEGIETNPPDGSPHGVIVEVATPSPTRGHRNSASKLVSLFDAMMSQHPARHRGHRNRRVGRAGLSQVLFVVCRLTWGNEFVHVHVHGGCEPYVRRREDRARAQAGRCERERGHAPARMGHIRRSHSRFAFASFATDGDSSNVPSSRVCTYRADAELWNFGGTSRLRLRRVFSPRVCASSRVGARAQVGRDNGTITERDNCLRLRLVRQPHFGS
jgi:hypothetical protein